MTSIGGELISFDGVVGGAALTAQQGANGALIPWMSTIAAGEKGATNQWAGAANTLELAEAPPLHTARDAGVKARHAFGSSVITNGVTYSQNVTAQQQSSQHLRITEFNTLMTNGRTARTAQAQADRGSTTTAATSAASLDDPLMNAAAKLWGWNRCLTTFPFQSSAEINEMEGMRVTCPLRDNEKGPEFPGLSVSFRSMHGMTVPPTGVEPVS